IAKDTGTEHERKALPSMSTVQEPHWPSPQPKRGPCNPRLSRSAYKSGICGSSATMAAGLPFTLSASFIEAPSPERHAHCVPARGVWKYEHESAAGGSLTVRTARADLAGALDGIAVSGYYSYMKK